LRIKLADIFVSFKKTKLKISSNFSYFFN